MSKLESSQTVDEAVATFYVFGTMAQDEPLSRRLARTFRTHESQERTRASCLEMNAGE